MKLRNICVALLVGLCAFVQSACRQDKDPEVAKLHEDVDRLSKENQQLKQQMDSLSSQVQEQQTQLSDWTEKQSKPPAQPDVPEEPKPQPMTVDRARAELMPVPAGMVKRNEDQRNTAVASGAYGMRTEYNLKSAVFGLIRNSEPGTPYLVKVLVPYEKYVVSESGSKSYGKDTERFLFAYRKQKWILLSNN